MGINFFESLKVGYWIKSKVYISIYIYSGRDLNNIP
jgi:hypothetical protein